MSLVRRKLKNPEKHIFWLRKELKESKCVSIPSAFSLRVVSGLFLSSLSLSSFISLLHRTESKIFCLVLNYILISCAYLRLIS